MGITIKRPNAKPGRHEESMSQRNIDLNKVHLHANLLALFFVLLVEKQTCSLGYN